MTNEYRPVAQEKHLRITEIAHSLAVQIRDRLEAQHVKGKRRDAMALELWLGAVMLARATDTAENERLANYLERLAVFLLSTRGFSWLVEYIGNPPYDSTKESEAVS